MSKKVFQWVGIRRVIFFLFLLVFCAGDVSGSSLKFTAGVAPTTRPAAGPVQVVSEMTCKVDGKLDEWAEVPPIVLNDKSQAFGPWSGVKDLAAKVRLGWDDQNLYVSCEVEDDVAVSPTLQFYGGLWDGDAVELGFDPRYDRVTKKYAPDDNDFAVALTANEGLAVWRYTAPDGQDTDRVKGMNLAVTRPAGKTGYVYELAVPWKELSPLRPFPGVFFGFSVVIIDNDNKGVKRGLQWTPGLWKAENPATFGTLTFRSKPTGADSVRLFFDSPGRVFTADSPAFRVGIESDRDIPGATVTARVRSKDNAVVAEAQQRMDLKKGLTELGLAGNPADGSGGMLRVELEVADGGGSRAKRSDAIYVVGGEFKGTMADLDNAVKRTLAQSIKDADPLLGLRTLDATMRVYEARRRLGLAQGVEAIPRVQALLDEAKTLTAGPVAGDSGGEDLLRTLTMLSSDRRVETMVETHKFIPGGWNFGVFQAGVPLATAYCHPFPTAAARQMSMDERTKWARDNKLEVSWKAVKNGRIAVVRHKDKWEETWIYRDRDFFNLVARTESAAMFLAEKLLSDQAITPEDVNELSRLTDWDPDTKVSRLCDLVGFDYKAAQVKVSDHAGRRERTAAWKIVSELGATMAGGEKVADAKNLIIVAAADDPLVRELVARDFLPKGKSYQGILTVLTAPERRTVVVTGRDGPAVAAAAGALVDLVKVLSERKVLAGDLHLHTNYSDGASPPVVTAWNIIRNYMDYAAITDHCQPKGATEAIAEFKSRGIRFPLLVGQEVSTSRGHVVVIGGDRVIPNTIESLKDLLAGAHAEGSLVFFAHPDAKEEWTRVALPEGANSGLDGFDAICDTVKFIPDWNRVGRLPSLICTTDTHWTTFTEVSRTIVFARSDQPKDIMAALREGYCLGYNSEGTWGSESLVNVFHILMDEDAYLSVEHLGRMLERVKSLGGQ